MSNQLLQDLIFRVSELERRLNNTIVEGVIAEVQASPYRVKVDYGTDEKPLLTGWLQVAVPRAAEAIVWWALEVGESVMVISPNGNMEQGTVYPATYSSDFMAPDNNLKKLVILFDDKSYFIYDKENKTMEVHTDESVKWTTKTFTLEAENFNVKAETRIDGNVQTTKDVTITGKSTASDHLSSGISGKGHIHIGNLGKPTSPPK